VTLRKGIIKAPHFAHQPPVTCEYGSGESEAHRQCKTAIYECLIQHPRVNKCEIERNLITVRPDVSAYINGTPVAIEVQLSTLSLEKIIYRTGEYARKGIFVLWLPLYTEALRRGLYRPSVWERWLHAAYRGRVYYWCEGGQVLPIHFRDFYADRRGRTRDYQKLSPMKVPIAGRVTNLTDNFGPVSRPPWSGKASSIPAVKLWEDTQPRWF
jgi:competence protein CoiA